MSLLLLLAAVAALARADLYTKNDGVVMLTKENFAETIIGGPGTYMVEFYAPWCGHCKNLAPHWKQAAKDLKGIVTFAAVNCDEQKELAQTFGIRGFPTIKYFGHDVVEKKKGQATKEPEDVNVERTAKALKAYAVSKLPSKFVAKVKDEGALDKFLTKDEALPHVILFSDKKEVSPLYKAASVWFRGRATFAQAGADDAMLARYALEAPPPGRVVLVPTSGDPVTFEKKISQEALFAFLEKNTAPAPEGPRAGGGGGKKKEKDAPPPKPAKPVAMVQLKGPADFEEYCESRDGICAIAFLDPCEGPVDPYVEMLTELAHDKHFAKRIHISWVDGPQQYDNFVSKFDALASGFPSLIVMSPKKKAWSPYIYAFDKASIAEWFGYVLRGHKRLATMRPLDPVPALVDQGEGSACPEEEPLDDEE